MADTLHELPRQVSDWHRIGGGFSVRFDISGGRFGCEWLPCLPTKREFKRCEGRPITCVEV